MEVLKSTPRSSHFGIACPYSDQRRETRKALLKAGLQNIRVGTIEFWQGEEIDLMIMDLVHAGNDHGALDFLGKKERLKCSSYSTDPASIRLWSKEKHATRKIRCAPEDVEKEAESEASQAARATLKSNLQQQINQELKDQLRKELRGEMEASIRSEIQQEVKAAYQAKLASLD
ncbi:hypothetical protein HO133_003940 [Letharia lupina]|uniref:DNA2/NAM7 helicase-like C-terminal domain-containing protein n=1 Tax=Letharia lupina TaxID=560253 RepID=A0A8H6CA01_9LECA|nr:uncharacterized protein HO133_003940 [Letharia lupina]KAF6219473.1 hypothetical protein HO133_003940 [Letharia lupina]